MWAAVIAGTARPVEMRLTPWWKRADRDDIARGKRAMEEMIRKHVANQPADIAPSAATLDEEEPWPAL